MTSNIKIAIVHDYIKEYGGAERVLEELHKLFPDAPIYTSIYAPEYLGPHRGAFEQMSAKGGSASGGKIKTSFLNLIPGREKLISIFRLLSPFAFRNLNLSKFDVIIVSQTGAYFPNLVKKGSAKLVCYTHTPPRYLYGYMTAREWQKDPLTRFFGTIANHFLRLVDFKASENVDYFIANSEEIRSRIKKFYRQDATVINPPVDFPKNQEPRTKNQSYYLAGGRLARAKGIDIIIRAFNENGKKLKVFGKGFAGFDEELRSIAKKNIEFVGEVTDDARVQLMECAKAYVFASFDEDFGITPVEAMSVGTPVIAYRSGGVKETVIDGKTGIFYSENTPEKLNEAVEKFEKTKISSEACRKQAQKFSSEVFDRKIVDFIKSKLKSQNSNIKTISQI